MKFKIAGVDSTAYEFTCVETSGGGRELQIHTDGDTIDLVLTRKDILHLTAALMYSNPDPLTQLD
jgi:hypothetical protein